MRPREAPHEPPPAPAARARRHAARRRRTRRGGTPRARRRVAAAAPAPSELAHRHPPNAMADYYLHAAHAAPPLPRSDRRARRGRAAREPPRRHKPGGGGTRALPCRARARSAARAWRRRAGRVAVGARIARTRQPRPRGRCAPATRGHQAQDGAMGGAAPPPEQQRLRFLSPNPTAPLVVFQCASRSGHAPSRLLFMGGRSARCAALRAP